MCTEAPTRPGAAVEGMAAPEDVLHEHAALLRQWAASQARITRLVQDYQRQIAALEAEVLRLRARQILATTRRLWALEMPARGAAAVSVRATAAAALASDHPLRTLAEAAQVICRTGCVGHAHPWLDSSLNCRLSGQACGQVTAPAAHLSGAG